jgi:hypothetical protein
VKNILHRPGLLRARWPFLAAIALAGACARTDSTAPVSPTGQVSSKLIGPLCQLGCVDVDPNPDAPGVFLGAGSTPADCFDGVQNDLDQDGIGDYCEKRLALAFDPELAYSHSDQVGREPHWAERLAAHVGRSWVSIAYLLSYYIDLGSEDILCDNYIGYQKCRGHYGDSEAIYLTVGYDQETQHWVLQQAELSQHLSSQTFSGDPPHSLTYPSHFGAYPRVYVAYGKHANYATISDCDNGNYFHMDECAPDTYARVGVQGIGDIGSSGHPLQDCMLSTNPLYSWNGVCECYWSGARFSGWQGSLPNADPYAPKLLARGF